MPKITTYEELLKFSEDLIEGKTQIEDIEITDGLDFTIKLKGRIWDGAIDFRIAKYVVDFQKSVDAIVRNAGIIVDKKTRPVVKFRVEEGCSVIEVKISEAVRHIVKNMTGGQITFVAVIAILSAVGYFTSSSVLEYKAKMLEYKAKELVQQNSQAIIKNYAQAFDEVVQKIPTYEKPIRRLTSNLEKNDTIESSITGKELTRAEVKKAYPDKSRVKAENVYIDGNYLITAIKLETGAITIEEGNHKFDCQSSLTDEELTDLFNKVQQAYSQKRGFRLDLKITAKYFKGSNSLKNLVIYEIGPPRKGAQAISSLLGNS